MDEIVPGGNELDMRRQLLMYERFDDLSDGLITAMRHLGVKHLCHIPLSFNVLAQRYLLLSNQEADSSFSTAPPF